jgi:hypothetical protein
LQGAIIGQTLNAKDEQNPDEDEAYTKILSLYEIVTAENT